LGPEFLDPLLLSDSEPVLFVHDEEAQVAEFTSRCSSRCVPTTTSACRLDPGQHPPLVGGCHEPGEHLDLDRVPLEPAPKALEVLGCEHGRGDQHRGLAAVGHG